MSLDYPDRIAWLAKRATPRKRKTQILHTSKTFTIAEGRTYWNKGQTYKRAK